MYPFNKITRLGIAVLAVLFLTVGSASAVVTAKTLTVGTASGAAGAEVLIPITIDDPSGVGGIAFTITYDPAALTFLGLAQATSGWTIKDPETSFKADAPIIDNVQYYNPYKNEAPYADRIYTLAGNATLFYQFNNVKDGSGNPLGRVLISGASAEPLTGTALFTARFQIKNTEVGGATYPVRIFRSIINNSAAGYSADTIIPALVGTGDKVSGMYTSTVFPVIPATLVGGGVTVTADSYGIGGKVTYGTSSGPLGVGCTVVLKKWTAAGYVFNDQTTVGTNGLYAFSNKYAGTYKISVQSLNPNYDNYESSAITLTPTGITNADAILPEKQQEYVTGQVAGWIPGLQAKVVGAGKTVGIYGIGSDGKWSSGLLPAGVYQWYLVYGSMISGPYAEGASTTFDTSSLKTISGTIAGLPGNASLKAFSAAAGNFFKTIPVANGSYTINYLIPANDYIVSVAGDGIPVTYYDGKTDFTEATKVDISTANAVNINFTFTPPGSHITGWIKEGGVGVSEITVYGFNVNTFALISAATNASGDYDLNVAPGTYEVFVIKGNGRIFYFYNENGTPTQSESGAVLRTVPPDQPNTNIDITECNKTLEGKVTYDTATGESVANVLVTASTATQRALGLTGQDGRYTIGGLCAATYDLAAKPLSGNYAVEYDTVTFSQADTKKTKDFFIDRGWLLSGTVKDKVTLAAIPGAMLYLKDQTTGALVGGRIFFSDQNGAYSIRVTQSGIYTLEVTHPDYRSYSISFMMESDTIQNVPLEKGAHFKGTVTDNSNPAKPLAGATIIVTRAGETPVYTVTNSAGFYSVYGLNSENFDYIIMAQTRGYERQAQTGKQPSVSGTTVDFALAKPAVTYTVSGWVKTSAAPSPEVGGAIVLVSSVTKNFFASTTTANDGTYTIAGLIGDSINPVAYRIVVIPGGNLPIQSRDFTVSNANVIENFTIDLGLSIGGTVSGPASGATVYVFLYKGTTYIGFTTTTTGAFLFKGLAAGTDYKLLAVSAGYTSQGADPITSGSIGITITLTAAP